MKRGYCNKPHERGQLLSGQLHGGHSSGHSYSFLFWDFLSLDLNVPGPIAMCASFLRFGRFPVFPGKTGQVLQSYTDLVSPFPNTLPSLPPHFGPPAFGGVICLLMMHQYAFASGIFYIGLLSINLLSTYISASSFLLLFDSHDFEDLTLPLALAING